GPTRRLATRQLRVVGPEQENVGRAPVLGVEHLPNLAVEAVVRRRHSVAELEVARKTPREHEHDEDHEDRGDPSEPSAIWPEAKGTWPGGARLLGDRGREARHSPLDAAAAVDPVGLVSRRHPAGYGSRRL